MQNLNIFSRMYGRLEQPNPLLQPQQQQPHQPFAPQPHRQLPLHPGARRSSCPMQTISPSTSAAALLLRSETDAERRLSASDWPPAPRLSSAGSCSTLAATATGTASYGTLPSRRRSAFARPPPKRWNELEEYAKQYEDFYSRRMVGSSGGGSGGGGGRNGSGAGTSNSGGGSGGNGYWFNNGSSRGGHSEPSFTPLQNADYPFQSDYAPVHNGHCCTSTWMDPTPNSEFGFLASGAGSNGFPIHRNVQQIHHREEYWSPPVGNLIAPPPPLSSVCSHSSSGGNSTASSGEGQVPSTPPAYLGHAQREHVPSRGVRGVKKQSQMQQQLHHQSATLPRRLKVSPSSPPPPAVSLVPSVQEEYLKTFSLTKRFFDDLDSAHHGIRDRGGGGGGSPKTTTGYSTMSLPRRMPVKKLVSAFNTQIERQQQAAPPKPIYSTLQRRLRKQGGRLGAAAEVGEADVMRRRTRRSSSSATLPQSDKPTAMAAASVEVLDVDKDDGARGETHEVGIAEIKALGRESI